MTTRETLIDLIETAIDSVHDLDVTHRDYAEASADAVLAALPGMVPDLVWEAEADRATCEDAKGIGQFYRVLHRRDGGGTLRFNGNSCGEIDFPTPESAKAAADAHHVAQIMAAFGIAPDAAADGEGE